MSESDKIKLRHDFLNSIVIINSLTMSATSFVAKISQNAIELDTVSKNQIELFVKSMAAIREQTKNIEKYVEVLW